MIFVFLLQSSNGVPKAIPEQPEPLAVNVDVNVSSVASAQSTPESLQDHILGSQINIVTFLCQKLDIPASEPITEDICTHPEFMRALSSVGASLKDYCLNVAEWKQLQSFSKTGSQVSQKYRTAESALKDLVVGLKELSSIKVVTGNLGVQLKSCQDKLNKMLGILPNMFDVKTALEQAIDSIRPCVRAQKQRKFNKLTGNSEYKLLCGNALGLTWEKAIECLSEMESESDDRHFVPLNLAQLLVFPTLKDSCHRTGMIGIPDFLVAQQYKLSDSDIKPAFDILLDIFPLPCVQKGGHHVLVDFTELIFKPGVVHELLTLDNPSEDPEEPLSKPLSNVDNEGIFFYKKTGPTPLQERVPQLLEVMMNFVRLHGFAAHIRQRTGTATSCGVALKDIREHVLENVDGLDKISKTKIYYLMQPARSNTRDAARHKDALDIRVGTKNCDVSKENTNAQEYFATVKNIRQMCAMYPDECVAFSCDSKAKIHIGGQAVSRYHQIKTFFPSDDCPHYNDHDFPVPGYLIEPDGYLLLQLKDTPAPMGKDKLGRDPVEVPQTGPLWVFNRCVKNTSTSIESHVKDIRVIFEENPHLKKPVLVLITDGGPDWTPKSNGNEFFLGKLWDEGNFDMLIAACMPAGLSRLNPIEHLWSPCSKFLAGVSLPACLPGEHDPPAQQNLPQAEKSEKERRVFENALEQLNMYWNGKVHDGFRITSKPVVDPVVDSDSDDQGDYELVKGMLNSSTRAINDEIKQEKLAEWKFYSKHMDRRCGLVCFKKGSCGDPACKCTGGDRGEIRATSVWKIPHGEKWLFPPITPDPNHPGHYMTLHQLEKSLAFSNPDQHLTGITTGCCTKCRYVDLENTVIQVM
jgi:hypothetical protein